MVFWAQISVNMQLCQLPFIYQAIFLFDCEAMRQCVHEMHLNLPIRGSECYTHPDNLQFTFSEIEQVQTLLNLTHGADEHALCWTLLSTVPTMLWIWVGPEGIKPFLFFSLSSLQSLLCSEVSDWRSVSACEWSEFSNSAICLKILTIERKCSVEMNSGVALW